MPTVHRAVDMAPLRRQFRSGDGYVHIAAGAEAVPTAVCETGWAYLVYAMDDLKRTSRAPTCLTCIFLTYRRHLAP